MYGKCGFAFPNGNFLKIQEDKIPASVTRAPRHSPFAWKQLQEVTWLSEQRFFAAGAGRCRKPKLGCPHFATGILLTRNWLTKGIFVSWSVWSGWFHLKEMCQWLNFLRRTSCILAKGLQSQRCRRPASTHPLCRCEANLLREVIPGDLHLRSIKFKSKTIVCNLSMIW